MHSLDDLRTLRAGLLSSIDQLTMQISELQRHLAYPDNREAGDDALREARFVRRCLQDIDIDDEPDVIIV